MVKQFLTKAFMAVALTEVVLEASAMVFGGAGGALHTVADFRHIPKGEFWSEFWSNAGSNAINDARDFTAWEGFTAQKTIEKISNH